MSIPENNSRININFSEVTKLISNGKESKRILKGVSGKFLSGQISAILGPSGAGKTTLMNILAGYKTSKASGDVLINEKPRCLESFRKISCYIKQDEQLLPFLTVKESMEVAAALKLGRSNSNLSKKRIINEILSTLGLKESKNTRVSNLSGGEKKRLTVAFELINNPLVMFFDEPTSGLDSYNSYQSIVYLKTLAKGDRNVICTIHQPSAKLFEQFDYVYVLAEGHCVYRGIVTNFLPFISSISLECPSHYNPADFMIEVASGVYGNFIIKMVEAVNSNFFLEHDRNNQDDLNPEVNSNSNEVKQEIIIPNYEEMSPYYQSLSQKDVYVSNTVPMRIQFYILLIRTLKSVFRDPMLTLFRLGVHLISGVCIGILYFRIGNEASKMQSNVGLLLICIVFIMFTSGATTSLTFPLEMKALIRELINNWYSLKAFYLAKTMVDIAFQIVFSHVFIIIIYIITNQPLEVKRLVTILIIGILNSLISQSLALSVGAGVDLQRGLYIISFVMLTPVIFSGFMILSSDIPVYFKWLTYLSFVRYCFEGTLKITYGYDRSQLHCSEEFCYFKYPKKILELYAVKDCDIWFDFLMLAIFFVLIRLLGYFILRWKIRREIE